MQPLPGIRRSRFLLDFLALLSSRAAAQALTLLVGLFMVRALSDSAFGAYSLATTTLGLAGIVTDFGLDSILTRDVASHRSGAAPLLRRAILLRLLFSGLVTAALLVGADQIPTLGRPDLLLIGGISLAPRGVMRAIAATLTGLGRARDAAWLEGFTALSASILTVVLVLVNFAFLGDRAAAAIWALGFGGTLGLAAGWPVMRGALGSSTGAQQARAGFLRLLRQAAPFMLIGLAGAAFQSLDIYVVRQFYWQPGGPDAVALYAAPFRVLNLLLLVPTAWGVVALPRYVRYVQRPAVAALALRRDLRRGTVAGCALALGCTAFAEPLTRLALGPTYAASAPILAVLGWMALPVSLSAPYIALLTAAHSQSRIAASVIAAGALALGANLLLAARVLDQDTLPGLIGVAAIKVISMVTLLGFYWLALPRTLLHAGRAILAARARRAV